RQRGALACDRHEREPLLRQARRDRTLEEASLAGVRARAPTRLVAPWRVEVVPVGGAELEHVLPQRGAQDRLPAKHRTTRVTSVNPLAEILDLRARHDRDLQPASARSDVDVYCPAERRDRFQLMRDRRAGDGVDEDDPGWQIAGGGMPDGHGELKLAAIEA